MAAKSPPLNRAGVIGKSLARRNKAQGVLRGTVLTHLHLSGPALTIWEPSLGIKYGIKCHAKAVDDYFTRFPEVDCNLSTNVALHLSDTPIRLAGVADKHSGSQHGVKIIHPSILLDQRYVMARLHHDLAALIGSRICHDLISPIGAINNGLELLSMSRDATGPEIGLIGESVENASARIRFFRVAFGMAGNQMVGPAETTSILRDLYGAGRLQVLWPESEPVQRRVLRICFLGVLCAETAMPYGGRISIARNGERWELTGTADRINVDKELWGMLIGGEAAPDLQPSQVQFALFPHVAEGIGRKVECTFDETRITLRF